MNGRFSTARFYDYQLRQPSSPQHSAGSIHFEVCVALNTCLLRSARLTDASVHHHQVHRRLPSTLVTATGFLGLVNDCAKLNGSICAVHTCTATTRGTNRIKDVPFRVSCILPGGTFGTPCVRPLCVCNECNERTPSTEHGQSASLPSILLPSRKPLIKCVIQHETSAHSQNPERGALA